MNYDKSDEKNIKNIKAQVVLIIKDPKVDYIFSLVVSGSAVGIQAKEAR
jgi:hypothetical protein